MMGTQSASAQLFCDFDLEHHVPDNHRLRETDRFPDADGIKQRGIIPFIPVIDQAERTDGTWSRSDFKWDEKSDQYICPEGHALRRFRRNYSDPNRVKKNGRHLQVPCLESRLSGLPVQTKVQPEHGLPCCHAEAARRCTRLRAVKPEDETFSPGF